MGKLQLGGNDACLARKTIEDSFDGHSLKLLVQDVYQPMVNTINWNQRFDIVAADTISRADQHGVLDHVIAGRCC